MWIGPSTNQRTTNAHSKTRSRVKFTGVISIGRSSIPRIVAISVEGQRERKKVCVCVREREKE